MFFKKTVLSALAVGLGMTTLPALSNGGISVQGTRIVYPQDAKQASLSVSNSSTTDSFLVQSWVEDASGHKTSDFIVTPPLYLSGPKNENTLRLIHTGGALPTDRETLYYFTAKAIPSIDDSKSGGNSAVLRIATANRIKLFVRPAGLKPSPGMAPAMLEFHQQAGELVIRNPTPYYLTLAEITSGGKALRDIMVPPLGTASDPLPAEHGSTVSFRTINDYGATTPAIIATIR
ncbi:fimbrial chaperone protein [Kosakonia arachidis]|uniref:Fimbrial chaperone protein n=1 Tax=Kosakonia arachidis TaxID=551989 RepID=A0A1I6XII8_9ENTR|nr:fimbria/pilus periplasmic chaperone [Kosakonia arachidis]SFT37897.1 fimbrial chaperone protein [Kosakonia arachidis]